MQYHSEFNHHRTPSRDRTPWNIAERPATSRCSPVFRRFAQLRERLVPYLGRAGPARRWPPTVRSCAPLFFDWPSDPTLWAWPGEFLLGDDLLVHPVTEPAATTWTTYLPRGTWVDVWTGEAYDGGRTVTRDVPRDVVPVYCRAESMEALRGVFG